MSLSPRTTTSAIGGTHTPAPLFERMRRNWRAPPTTLHESQQKNPDVSSEFDVINPDPCLPITITTELTITLPYPSTILVPHTITYTPSCSGTLPIPTGTGTNKTPTNDAPDSSSSDLPASSLRDPFYASTIPMAYSIAMTITLSYVLLFLLFLSTPRPWLQKVATLTVVICLTLALAETTRILALEYSLMGETWTADTESGSAKQIREKVVAGTEMRVGRIISDTFLWLAQVQTLIRLFPRHREKIVIKWAGFALIVLDTIFSILVHFLSPTTIMSPESFLDAIPALSYLFQIALSLLYAACVVYYSLSSRIRRFAYYHPKAPSNILIAILSLIAVLIPMVFFCLDIGQKDLAAWGDYVRWVGAAAASVVVWEWVDRIERLEREERREGVLGREIFDGDDGLVEDMGISQEDDDRGKGSGSNDRPGGNGGGAGEEPTRGITVSGALADTDPAGTMVNRHSRHLVASYHHGSETPGTANSDPSVISTVYATRRSVVGDSPTHQQLRATSRSPTEDGSDSGGRRTNIGFVSLRHDRRATMSTYSERSTPGPVSNRTTLSTDDGVGVEHGGARDSSEKASTVAPSPQATPDPEKQQGRDSESGKRDGSWLVNPFKRRQHHHEDAPSEGSSSGRSRWTSFKPNLPFSLPFLGALSSNGLVRDSASDKRRKDGPGKRQLPVTVIPAPPRGRGISLRELEEARRSGVGDENVRGVGVWTGNSMRTAGNYPNNHQGGSIPTEHQLQQWSTSPGYGDSQERSLQERLQQHELQWNAQQYQEVASRQQRELSRNQSTMQSPLSSLPPLPPSPAVTATTSSWSMSQLPYAQQYTRGSAPPVTPGPSSISGIYPPSAPPASLTIMSGAVPAPPVETSPPPPQVAMARQAGSSAVGARSRSTTASAGLGVVEEGAGSIRSEGADGEPKLGQE